MQSTSLYRWYEDQEPLQLPPLKRGMVVVMVMDDGPGGTCGQCMSITCPWQYLHIFPSKAEYYAFVESKPSSLGRNGQKQKVAYCIIGEYGTGHMRVVVHEELEPPQTTETQDHAH